MDGHPFEHLSGVKYEGRIGNDWTEDKIAWVVRGIHPDIFDWTLSNNAGPSDRRRQLSQELGKINVGIQAKVEDQAFEDFYMQTPDELFKALAHHWFKLKGSGSPEIQAKALENLQKLLLFREKEGE